MQSRNPIFARSEGFKQGGYASFNTPQTAPPAWGSATGSGLAGHGTEAPVTVGAGRMTMDDVVVRTATVFAVLLLTAAVTWQILTPANVALLWVGMALGLVLGLVNSFKRTPSPALILAYGAAEGVFVGGISRLLEWIYPGIVIQAVVGTLATFVAMLGLYRSGVIRATPRFKKMMMIAMFGYLIFGVVHLLGVVLHLWTSVFAGSMLGLAISVFAVGLASFSLVLDFDYVEQGIRNGLPTQFAWQAAFGLVVTLVWLYLEILRLLAILASNRD